MLSMSHLITDTDGLVDTFEAAAHGDGNTYPVVVGHTSIASHSCTSRPRAALAPKVIPCVCECASTLPSLCHDCALLTAVKVALQLWRGLAWCVWAHHALLKFITA